MIIDTRASEINSEISYDVCIIGAGAAGITIALELAKDSSLKLAVLESGGEHFASRAQSLLQGEVEGDRHPPLWRSRFSGLGGSTQVWAGWCRPLQAFDFERRDYIKNSGWPIRFDELQPAYRRASEICGLGSYPFELENWQELLKGESLATHPDLKHDIFQVRKLHFDRHYIDELKQAENISLYLYSPVMRLHTGSDGQRIAHVEVASYQNSTTFIRAKHFVLATGGIENARLLLLSGPDPEHAPGNQHDCVGRYYIDHGFIDSGWFIPNRDKQDLTYYFPVPHPHDVQNATARPVITLSADVLQKEKLLNAAMYFYPAYEAHPVFASEAVKAALELWDIVKTKSATELWEITRCPPAFGDLWDFCRRIGSRPHYVLYALLRKLLVRDTSAARWRLRFYYECVPSAENRVVLGEQKDRFNRPLARLNWHLSEQDMDSARRFHVYLNGIFQQTGAGELTFFDELSQWRSNTETGKHPSGTTRMHDDPKFGVVDKNCRVHGMDNLFIAGSSVFPGVGYANPTLTIVALAVRLADHLRSRLSQTG